MEAIGGAAVIAQNRSGTGVDQTQFIATFDISSETIQSKHATTKTFQQMHISSHVQ